MHHRHHHKGCHPMGISPAQNAVSPAQNIVYPTKHCVKNNFIPHEVNHIHPTHTTVMNHHLVNNKHFYPQTQSVQSNVQSQQTNMGPGLPNMVSPASMGPGGPNAVSPASMNKHHYKGC
ncbi:spore coat protein D [Salinibacillus kushneri]|uniref:Spore coat protein D n=1 Tax=Salinibacillus kushneri TaxID=237682 RepID=A0A1I0DHA6_9BACI|nr:CotD family spore coat protein [Salinibacillus kushneri]SET31411.1 spore coat protein D [Salinibacillus kushneri]